MASFGETLRRERELREISLREISESTKINLRYLDALERDDFRHLPGGVFNKGFVRAFSEYIGIDAEAMVNAYLDEERQQRERDRQVSDARQHLIGTTSPVGRPVPRSPGRSAVRMRAAAGVAVALFVAATGVVAFFVWREFAGGEGRRGSAPPALESGARAGAEPGVLAGGLADTTDRRQHEPPAAAPGSIQPTRLVLARETSGRAWCEGGSISMLNGLPAGSTLEFPCGASLNVEAADAGAVLVVTGGSDPRPLGPDGQRASGPIAAAIGASDEGPR